MAFTAKYFRIPADTPGRPNQSEPVVRSIGKTGRCFVHRLLRRCPHCSFREHGGVCTTRLTKAQATVRPDICALHSPGIEAFPDKPES